MKNIQTDAVAVRLPDGSFSNKRLHEEMLELSDEDAAADLADLVSDAIALGLTREEAALVFTP